MRKAMLTLAVLLVGAAGAHADGWAEKMFNDGKDVSHDFGNVPRGTQLHYRFTITNIYAVPMEITSIIPSCGCTEAKPSKRVLQPKESASIDVTMDASRFIGNKSVDVKVTVGPEFISSAVLKITANSRADLVFNPGEISFGNVTLGQEAEQTIDIDYAGALKWQVTDVVAKDLPLKVSFEKLTRKEGQVGYRITAKLTKDAPAGERKYEIYLKTNDPDSPLVPIVVEATVQPPVTVTPSALNLSTFKVGDVLTRRVVVRGSKKFKITGIDGLTKESGLKLGNELPTEEAVAHTVTLQIQPDKAGDFKREVKIHTTLQDAPLVVTIEGKAEAP